jgi:predicted DNA repair protein MutK
LIVKLDDIGLHLAKRRRAGTRAIGDALVRTVPKLLTALSAIGTAAMLWVGGGILLHGLEELHLLYQLPELVHRLGETIAGGAGALEVAIEWLVGAVASAVVGLAVGGAIVAVVRTLTKHPEKLITD